MSKSQGLTLQSSDTVRRWRATREREREREREEQEEEEGKRATLFLLHTSKNCCSFSFLVLLLSFSFSFFNIPILKKIRIILLLFYKKILNGNIGTEYSPYYYYFILFSHFGQIFTTW